MLSWSPIPYSGGSQCHTKANTLLTKSLCIWKKLSRRRLTRCYKWEFWSLWTKQLLGSTGFVLVEGMDKQGNLKLRICLDLTNLKMANCARTISLKDPRRYSLTACRSLCYYGLWLQKRILRTSSLDEASLLLTTFNTELVRFWCTVMPFGATVSGDVFQRKLDECLAS